MRRSRSGGSGAGLGEAREANLKAYYEMLRKDLRAEARAIFRELMQLSADQEAKFQPLHDQFEKAFQKLADERVALVKTLPLFALASAIPAPAQTVPPNTYITVRTIDNIEGRTASAGQRFRATVDEPVNVAGRESRVPPETRLRVAPTSAVNVR